MEGGLMKEVILTQADIIECRKRCARMTQRPNVQQQYLLGQRDHLTRMERMLRKVLKEKIDAYLGETA
jgi:hypothetical protein